MGFVQRVRRAWAIVLKFSRLQLYYVNPCSPANSLGPGVGVGRLLFHGQCPTSSCLPAFGPPQAQKKPQGGTYQA